jgi:death-on-curing protein
VDGNKRTAWTAAKVFLLLNGYRLTATVENAETALLGVIQGDIDSEELTDWIEEHSKVI